MLKAGIQGFFTIPCMAASPTANCPGPAAPNSVGQAIHSESTNTTAVVSSVIQRMASSRALGMIGRASSDATRAGRKTIAVRGQRAGWARESTGGMAGVRSGSGCWWWRPASAGE
jgi:hypothetical protein